MTTSAEGKQRSPYLPPRWFIRVAWVAHRALYRLTGGRRGLWRPTPGKWGTLLLTSTGRKSGKPREAILGYYEDGPNLVTMAMNGWGAPEPAWWLNLQAQPEATIQLKDRAVAAWARWQETGDDVDGYSVRRPGETAVVVLEPVPEAGPA